MSAKKPDHQSQVKTEEERAFAQMIPACAFDGTVLLTMNSPDPFSFGRTRFRKGDDVMLHSVHIATADVWIGRILKIRTAPDHSDTLVKVRWYWSRNDVAKHAKTFDASQCAPLERILSDDYDYVSPYSFERVVYVHEYDETSLDPPLLTSDDLFVRAKFLHRKRMIKPPLGADTCFCQQAYNPFPPLPLPMSTEDEMMTTPYVAPHSDVMHFCPAAACRKWYHTSCLLSRQAVLASLPAESQGAGQNLIDMLPPQTRGLRLLAVNPDEEVLFTTFEYFYEPESQQEVHRTDDLPLSEALELLSRSPAIIGHLPPGLLAVAQSPIIRFSNGPKELAVGNVSDVVLARRREPSTLRCGVGRALDRRLFARAGGRISAAAAGNSAPWAETRGRVWTAGE
ncbi:hypothetical protein C8Q77DRAFT_1055715 [Trametes polyzona]|nr:hypothetical protein C8Q77DRAFT_1055715 [Trametes polyzona]